MKAIYGPRIQYPFHCYLYPVSPIPVKASSVKMFQEPIFHPLNCKEEETMKTVRRIFRKKTIGLTTALFVGILALRAAPATADEAVKQQGLVDKSRVTFQSFMLDENLSWLHENLHRAKGLIIIPRLLKAGFILGGSGGTGILVLRDGKTGQWSQPAFYNIGSVTFGLQIGGEAAEAIMFVRTQKAVEKLYASSFKLGGDVSAALGPVGSGVKSNGKRSVELQPLYLMEKMPGQPFKHIQDIFLVDE